MIPSEIASALEASGLTIYKLAKVVDRDRIDPWSKAISRAIATPSKQIKALDAIANALGCEWKLVKKSKENVP